MTTDTTLRSLNSTAARVVLTAVIIELTVATAYIHANLGGLLFSLNALGFMALAAAYLLVAVLPIGRRFGWLPRIGLAGFTLLTIGAYLVMGPYFPLGWIAKGIEVAIIGLVIVDVLTIYDSPIGRMRAAVGSLVDL
jgi:hypothetical protein